MPAKWNINFNFSFSFNETSMLYIWKRIVEPSSWAGIAIVLTAFDRIWHSGTFTQANVGEIIAGLVAVFLPNRNTANDKITSVKE